MARWKPKIGAVRQQLVDGISQPEQLLRDCQAANAEDTLIDFIELTWHEIEPAIAFVRGWVLEGMCEHLEAVSHGRLQRLLLNVPPGFSKSLTTNVFWPAWEWGPKGRADRKYVCASYQKELSQRDNQRFRNLIQSPTYQTYWGSRFKSGELEEEEDIAWEPRFLLKGDQNTKTKIENSKTGFKLAISSGSGTGERGDRVNIDDPHSVKDTDSDAKREAQVRWFAETMPTRTISKESASIVTMQRIHARDVAGHILEKELGYEHFCVPMEFEADHPFAGKRRSRIGWRDPRKVEGELAWPELFDRERVEQLKEDLRSHGGTYAEDGQLQQRPAPRGGGLFRMDDFQIVDAADLMPGGRAVRAWDLAGTAKKLSPYTVGVKMWRTWNGEIVVGDVRRIQGGPKAVRDLIILTAQSDGFDVEVDIPQDPGQAGKAQVLDLVQALHGYLVSFSPESGDKVARARPYAAQVAARNVFLVQGAWNDAYRNELGAFPAGRFADQADASSRAYYHVISSPEPLIGAVAPYRGSVAT